MKPVISCIRLSGASIPAKISEHLAVESAHLYHSTDKVRDFKGKTYGGRIKTDRQSGFFFVISGISFEAEIEFEVFDKTSRKVLVLFLVSPSVLAMNFSRDYDFMVQDIEDFFREIDPEAEEMIRDHMAKYSEDTIGKTAGSC